MQRIPVVSRRHRSRSGAGRSPCFIWLVTCRTRDYVFVVPCSWQIEYRYDSLFFLFVCSHCKKWFLWLKATNEFVGPVFSLLQNIEKEQFQDITLPDWEGFKTETRSMRNQLSQQIKHFRKTDAAFYVKTIK